MNEKSKKLRRRLIEAIKGDTQAVNAGDWLTADDVLDADALSSVITNFTPYEFGQVIATETPISMIAIINGDFDVLEFVRKKITMAIGSAKREKNMHGFTIDSHIKMDTVSQMDDRILYLRIRFHIINR